MCISPRLKTRPIFLSNTVSISCLLRPIFCLASGALSAGPAVGQPMPTQQGPDKGGYTPGGVGEDEATDSGSWLPTPSSKVASVRITAATKVRKTAEPSANSAPRMPSRTTARHAPGRFRCQIAISAAKASEMTTSQYQ